MIVAPPICTSRLVHHASHQGGKFQGAPYDLTCVCVEIPNTGVWVVLHQSPTDPPKGASSPTTPEGHR